MSWLTKSVLGASIVLTSILNTGCISLSSNSNQQRLEQIIEKNYKMASRPTVCVRSNKNYIGTAFAYAEKGDYIYFLTNHHLIEKRSLYDEIKLEIVDNDLDYYEKDNIPLELVLYSEDKDIAIFKAPKKKINEWNKNKIEPIEVYKGKIGSSRIIPGERVLVCGYTLGRYKALTEGIVSYIADCPMLKYKHKDVAVDAAANAGNSGSPILKYNGNDLELIGIFHVHHEGSEGMNHGILISEIEDLLKKALEY